VPAKKYLVDLTDEERATLEQLLCCGTHSARTLTRARVLLKANAGWRDHDIARAVDTSRLTVERLRKRFMQFRLGALEERPRPGKKPLLDAKGEARLIAEACAAAPQGCERWPLQLLANRVVELQLADSCSKDTVRRVLKKTRSSRG
jgi:transposase